MSLLRSRHVYGRRRSLLGRVNRPRDRPASLAILAGLAGLAVVLIVFDAGRWSISQPLRAAALSFNATVGSIVRQPLIAAEQAGAWFRNAQVEADRVVELRRRIAELEVWQLRAEELEARLAELAGLAEAVTAPQMSFKTAEVIGVTSDLRRHGLVISTGQQHGVALNQAVVDARGLLGVIEETSHSASRVRLLQDVQSVVAVLIGPSRIAGTVSGTGETLMPVQVSNAAGRQVAEGDLVITSGRDGRMPRGLRVGRIARAGPG
ncbi:MAG: rod shape-determining protein MreC [Pseudomonadota bacterium]